MSVPALPKLDDAAIEKIDRHINEFKSLTNKEMQMWRMYKKSMQTINKNFRNGTAKPEEEEPALMFLWDVYPKNKVENGELEQLLFIHSK